MKRLNLARLVLGLAGVVVWGYGHRYDLASTRIAGIGILVVALVLRFVPPRWLDRGVSPPG